MWGNQANCYTYACNCKVPANSIPPDKSDMIHHIPMAKTKTLDDATFIDATKTAKQHYAQNWPGMDFVAYFGLGDIKGMTVAGIAAAGNVLA
jgi:hypothetical protein